MYATLQAYCFEPVVLFLGFGAQFKFCGLASFSHAARLAYLQFRAPPGDVAMQNAAFPVVCGACIPLELVPIVPCAWAIEMPATSATTAVSVVRVFIICLLGSFVPAQIAALRNNGAVIMAFPEPDFECQKSSLLCRNTTAGNFRRPLP